LTFDVVFGIDVVSNVLVVFGLTHSNVKGVHPMGGEGESGGEQAEGESGGVPADDGERSGLAGWR